MNPPAQAIDPVCKEIELPCDPARAFHLFTDRLSSWWPLATHSICGDNARSCHIDARVGGHIYEVGPEEEHHVWGTVQLWEPPHRLVFSFHPGRDEATAGTVEVSFRASGGGCRVELLHRGWELLAENAVKMRDGYDTGWGDVFGRRFYSYALNLSRS